LPAKDADNSFSNVANIRCSRAQVLVIHHFHLLGKVLDAVRPGSFDIQFPIVYGIRHQFQERWIIKEHGMRVKNRRFVSAGF
jgi:hypothetical protein